MPAMRRSPPWHAAARWRRSSAGCARASATRAPMSARSTRWKSADSARRRVAAAPTSAARSQRRSPARPAPPFVIARRVKQGRGYVILDRQGCAPGSATHVRLPASPAGLARSQPLRPDCYGTRGPDRSGPGTGEGRVHRCSLLWPEHSTSSTWDVRSVTGMLGCRASGIAHGACRIRRVMERCAPRDREGIAAATSARPRTQHARRTRPVAGKRAVVRSVRAKRISRAPKVWPPPLERRGLRPLPRRRPYPHPASPGRDAAATAIHRRAMSGCAARG